jgi:hypothetical protein
MENVSFSIGGLRLGIARSEIIKEPQSLLAAIISDQNHPRDRDGSLIIGNRDIVAFSLLMSYVASPATFVLPIPSLVQSVLAEAENFRIQSLQNLLRTAYPLFKISAISKQGYKVLSTTKDLAKCDWSEGVFVWNIDPRGSIEEYHFKGSTHRKSKKRKADANGQQDAPLKIRTSWFLYQTLPENKYRVQVHDDAQRFDVFNNLNTLVARGYKGAFGDSVVVERSEGKMFYLIDAPASLQTHQLRVEVELNLDEDGEK